MSLAAALASAGRFDEARREFSEVLRINPRNQAARNALDYLSRK